MRIKKLKLYSTLLLFSSLSLMSCNKNKCKYNGIDHVHKYVLVKDNYKFIRYSNKEEIKNFSKTNEVLKTKKNLLLDYYNNETLVSISINKPEINKILNNNKEYNEYEYWYIRDETVNHVYKKSWCYNWTTNNKKRFDLTGNKRKVVLLCRGIKLNDEGKEEYSNWVRNIEELDKNYEYFNYDTCIKKGYIEDKNNVKRYKKTVVIKWNVKD